MQTSIEDVRRYYDNNSRKFERYGQAGQSFHRAVWAPGVHDRRAAVNHVHELIARELAGCAPNALVADLGCGVGASLIYLASKLDVRGEGVTLSPVQAARAEQLIRAARLQARVRCRAGNYLDLPPEIRDVALAFAIEAFVHCNDPRSFFDQASRALESGGKLVICDDFAARPPAERSTRDARWVREFCLGWRAPSLLAVGELRDLARAAGLELVRDIDLSRHLELGRPRDHLIRWILRALKPLALKDEYWLSLIGGNALQLALKSGAIEYRFLVFEKS